MDPGRPGWLFLELWSTARHSVRLVAELLAQEGVGDDELACLLQLSASAGGLTITEIAYAMGVPFMSASDAVTPRTGRRRGGEPHPSDRRSSLIRLTKSGARRADAAATLLDRLARSLTRSAGTTPATARAEIARLADVFTPGGDAEPRSALPVCHGSVILREDGTPARRPAPPALRGAGRRRRAAAAHGGAGRACLPDERDPVPAERLDAAAGSLWLACRDGSRVERRAPSGKLVATIRTPGFRPWAIASAGDAVGWSTATSRAPAHLDQDEHARETDPFAGGPDLCLGWRRGRVARLRRQRLGGACHRVDQPCRCASLRRRRAVWLRDRRVDLGALASRRRTRPLRRHDVEDPGPPGGG